MFKVICRFILLAISTILVMSCTTSNLGIYDRNRSAYAGSVFSPNPEQQERERQMAEMKRLVAMQRQSKEGVREIPIELAQKLLTGTLKGSACNEKIPVVINLLGPNRRALHMLRVNGTARISHQPEQSESPPIVVTLEGSFNVNSGVLHLRSVPTPPTQEQMQRRLHEATADYEAKKRENSEEKEKIAKKVMRMTQQERARALPELLSKIDELEKPYILNMQALALPTPPPISLKMDIARDDAGNGWIGVIEGDGFNECPQIALTSEEGLKTAELRPITGEVAFAEARPIGFNWPSKTIQIYWLNIAADKGNANAQFALGQLYEEQGKEAPQDYPRALRYYRAAGDKGNAQAQSALSRMYHNGWGAPRDPKESQRWAKLAESQYARASKVCVAPKTVEEIDQLIKEDSKDPAVRKVQDVVFLFGQMVINLGTHQIRDISLERFSSIDLPFRCTVTAKRIDARVTNFTPKFEYIGTDNNGNMQFRDQRVDRLIKENIADKANEMAKQDFYQSFDVEPQGGQRYKLTLVRTIAEAREYSKIIDLD